MTFYRFAVLALLTVLAVFDAHAQNLELHVSPRGADASPGTSAERPARTLKRALDTARQQSTGSGDIVVQFAPGDYVNETLEVDWFPGNNRKLILLGESKAGRARFDGGGSNRRWLVIRGRRGALTHLVVQGFEVRNYWGAIAIYGDRFDDTSWSGGNRIEGNVFENIGQFRKEVRPAFSAITLSNSRDNVIARNVFRNIRNIDKCDGLHAIYLSGGTSGNRITENVFDGGCGDTIKTRDRSNNNEIRGNQFLNQTGKSIFVDSFCDGRKVAECAEKKQECPSWGNVFAGNKVDEGSRRAVKAVTRTVGGGNIPGCPLPMASHVRIVEQP